MNRFDQEKNRKEKVGFIQWIESKFCYNFFEKHFTKKTKPILTKDWNFNWKITLTKKYPTNFSSKWYIFSCDIVNLTGITVYKTGFFAYYIFSSTRWMIQSNDWFTNPWLTEKDCTWILFFFLLFTWIEQKSLPYSISRSSSSHIKIKFDYNGSYIYWKMLIIYDEHCYIIRSKYFTYKWMLHWFIQHTF